MACVLNRLHDYVKAYVAVVEANTEYQHQLMQSKSLHSPVTDPLGLWDEIHFLWLLSEKLGDIDPKLASVPALDRWGCDLKLCIMFTNLFSVAHNQLAGPPPLYVCR